MSGTRHAGKGLTRVQEELVYQRAVELERAAARGEQAMMSADDVERIGREAGIAPEALRQAIAEVRAGLSRELPAVTVTDRVVGPRLIVFERIVPGDAEAVRSDVCRFLESQLMRMRRNLGERTLWEHDPGFVQGLKRTFDWSKRYAVPDEAGVEATVVSCGAREVLVRFAVDLSAFRAEQLRPVTRRTVITVIATGLTVWILGAPELMLDVPWTFAVPGTGTLWTLSAVRNAHLRQHDVMAIIGASFERFLDDLQHGRH